MYVLTVYGYGYKESRIFPSLTRVCKAENDIAKNINEILDSLAYSARDLLMKPVFELKAHITTENDCEKWRKKARKYTQYDGWYHTAYQIYLGWGSINSVYHYCAQYIENAEFIDDDDENCFNGFHVAIVVQEFND